jgi:hypothetical protein
MWFSSGAISDFALRRTFSLVAVLIGLLGAPSVILSLLLLIWAAVRKNLPGRDLGRMLLINIIGVLFEAVALILFRNVSING